MASNPALPRRIDAISGGPVGAVRRAKPRRAPRRSPCGRVPVRRNRHGQVLLSVPLPSTATENPLKSWAPVSSVRPPGGVPPPPAWSADVKRPAWSTRGRMDSKLTPHARYQHNTTPNTSPPSCPPGCAPNSGPTGPSPRSSTCRLRAPTGSPTRPSCAAPAPADRTRRADTVVRVAPTKHLLFMDAHFDTQYRVMRTLAEGNTAVSHSPRSVGTKRTPNISVSRSSRWTTSKVVPSDNIPYTMDGWVKEATPEQQERCGGAASTPWPRSTGPIGGPSASGGWTIPPGGGPVLTSRCRTTGTSSTGPPRG